MINKINNTTISTKCWFRLRDRRARNHSQNCRNRSHIRIRTYANHPFFLRYTALYAGQLPIGLCECPTM